MTSGHLVRSSDRATNDMVGDSAETAYWSRPAAEVADALGSGPLGLTSARAAAELAATGPNAIEDAWHFEGRSWTGLHRHALMTMIAYAFLQSRRLKQAKREKKNQGPATPADLAGHPRGHRRQARTVAANTMSALPPTGQF